MKKIITILLTCILLLMFVSSVSAKPIGEDIKIGEYQVGTLLIIISFILCLIGFLVLWTGVGSILRQYFFIMIGTFVILFIIGCILTFVEI